MTRLWQSTVTELVRAVRSRRALVVLVLYLAMSLLCMNGAISAMATVEDEVAAVLQLPENKGKSGALSATLWKSDSFRRAMRKMSGGSLVYEDIQGRHPMELLYALLAFLYVPLLTILVAANRVADDLRSGSVRYMITRVTRLEWSLGKYSGLAVLLGASIFIGGFAAWGVAVLRLGGADFSELLVGILGWSGKAWFLSLAWLGISLGVSHFFHSGAKATALATVVMTAFAVAPKILSFLAAHRKGIWISLEPLTRLFPAASESGLWRASFLPVASASVWLVMLGLFYFSVGFAFFAGRDAR